MHHSSRRAGSIFGLALGILGLVVGLNCAWLGLESQPHTVFAGGMCLGLLGALAGLTCAFFGVAWKRIHQAS